jgi:transketolase
MADDLGDSIVRLQKLADLVRYFILQSTTRAGSGHPTSSLSAVELMVGLMFSGQFKATLDDPTNIHNDRLLFSKGHAAPLLYSLYAATGKVEETELLSLRKFDSNLEGHPTLRFAYTEVPTGSLGQGLSVGVGMALSAKMNELNYRTYVLLGDSEMTEGQVWEAMQLASHYKLNNLVAVVDVNRLGQRGETMTGWDIKSIANKAEAFSWNAIMLEDGHHLGSILRAYNIAQTAKQKPTMIIAKTVKGMGVSFLEDKEGWHGKALSSQELNDALLELGDVDNKLVGRVEESEVISQKSKVKSQNDNVKIKMTYELGEMVATRKAFGGGLVKLGTMDEEVVVLDAEVGNSTYTEMFGKQFPERFVQGFIAEQNLVGMALGLERRGKKPYMATFAAFWTRAYDQLRMTAQVKPNLTVVGTHAGVSIGEDGASQMGLEDIAMFRSLYGSSVVYPADAVAMQKIMEASLEHEGLMYIRSTRMETAVIYGQDEEFVLGGSKTLKHSNEDKVTLIGAGVTLYECLKAYEQLKQEGIMCRVIDLYSIKPIDTETLVKACKETQALIVVEDHYPEGGMAEAVRSTLIYETTPIHSLAVRKLPRSGKPEELLSYEEIDAEAIVEKVSECIK